jgi:hypothetical protein
MNAPALQADVAEELRADLETIPGVRRAVVDGPPLVIHLICQRDDTVPVELLARAVLVRRGQETARAELHVSYLASPGPPRRVRFVRAHLANPTAGRAKASVALEWEGKVYESGAEGESGAAIELRLAALAALRTVEAVIRGALRFQLLGVKTVRAFDSDLVVALVAIQDAPERPLLGAAITDGATARAATLAVLNATNRILGNYLVTES